MQMWKIFEYAVPKSKDGVTVKMLWLSCSPVLMPIRLFFWGFQKDYIYQPQLQDSIQKMNDITGATVAIKQHVLKDSSAPFCLQFHNNNCIKSKHNIIFKGQKDLHVSAS
jgi:hypothetical protein